jgi:hypothetical protein
MAVSLPASLGSLLIARGQRRRAHKSAQSHGDRIGCSEHSSHGIVNVAGILRSIGVKATNILHIPGERVCDSGREQRAMLRGGFLWFRTDTAVNTLQDQRGEQRAKRQRLLSEAMTARIKRGMIRWGDDLRSTTVVSLCPIS